MQAVKKKVLSRKEFHNLTDQDFSDFCGEEVRRLPEQEPPLDREPWYVISQSGKVYSLALRRTGRVHVHELTQTKNTDNPCVMLFGRAWTVARLVALAWIGPPPSPLHKASFRGKVPTAETVFWGNPSEMSEKAVITRKRRGHTQKTVYERSQNRQAVIQAATYRALRTRYKDDFERHGISYVVDRILCKHLSLPEPAPPVIRRHARATTLTKKIEIDLRLGLYRYREIATRHDTSISYVQVVARRLGGSALRNAKRRNRDLISQAESGAYDLAALAAAHKLSESMVQQILLYHKIDLPELRKRKAQEMYINLIYAPEKWGIEAAIKQVSRELGIPIKRVRGYIYALTT
jgi:hypothetical protein